jgi:hypothetical protein
VTVRDNDGSATVSVTATDAAGAEQAADAIAFTPGGNVWSSVVVNLARAGTATSGSDYTVSATGGTLSGKALDPLDVADAAAVLGSAISWWAGAVSTRRGSRACVSSSPTSAAASSARATAT